MERNFASGWITHSVPPIAVLHYSNKESCDFWANEISIRFWTLSWCYKGWRLQRMLRWDESTFFSIYLFGSARSQVQYARSLIFITARGLFSCMNTLTCGMWNPVPWPGMEPEPPALGVWSLGHWTTKEVPRTILNYLGGFDVIMKVLYKWNPQRLSKLGRPCDVKGRDWSNGVMSQGMPGASSSGRMQGRGSLLEPPKATVMPTPRF